MRQSWEEFDRAEYGSRHKVCVDLLMLWRKMKRWLRDRKRRIYYERLAKWLENTRV
jgi:hypothetical protein